MRIYLDTNIVMDFLLNRTDGLRPLGEFAYEVFQRCISCEFYIIISDHLIEELETNGFNLEEINDFILELNKKFLFIKKNKEDIIRAHHTCRIHATHFKDALHYVIANRSADKLLTNDNELLQLPLSVGYENL